MHAARVSLAERRALGDYLRGDTLLRRFFEVFLFEELPASDRRADEVYLDEVDRCTIYLGLFGGEYGSEDAAGVSRTEYEFQRAGEQGTERLIFVKGGDRAERHPKMRALIGAAGRQVIRRRFADISDLVADVYASLVEHLERSGRLRTGPFDAAACPRATLADLSDDRIALLADRRPTHAAALIFGRQPQRFLLSSEVKCMHFHGHSSPTGWRCGTPVICRHL